MGVAQSCEMKGRMSSEKHNVPNNHSLSDAKKRSTLLDWLHDYQRPSQLRKPQIPGKIDIRIVFVDSQIEDQPTYTIGPGLDGCAGFDAHSAPMPPFSTRRSQL